MRGLAAAQGNPLVLLCEAETDLCISHQEGEGKKRGKSQIFQASRSLEDN